MLPKAQTLTNDLVGVFELDSKKVLRENIILRCRLHLLPERFLLSMEKSSKIVCAASSDLLNSILLNLFICTENIVC